MSSGMVVSELPKVLFCDQWYLAWLMWGPCHFDLSFVQIILFFCLVVNLLLVFHLGALNCFRLSDKAFRKMNKFQFTLHSSLN